MKEDLSEHWVGMPEFVQPSKAAVKRVTINFLNEADIEKFNELTGLKITMKTKGVFFPLPETKKIEYVDGN